MDDDDEMQEREKTLGGKIREDINLGGRSRKLHVQLQTTLVSLRSTNQRQEEERKSKATIVMRSLFILSSCLLVCELTSTVRAFAFAFQAQTLTASQSCQATRSKCWIDDRATSWLFYGQQVKLGSVRPMTRLADRLEWWCDRPQSQHTLAGCCQRVAEIHWLHCLVMRDWVVFSKVVG